MKAHNATVRTSEKLAEQRDDKGRSRTCVGGETSCMVPAWKRGGNYAALISTRCDPCVGTPPTMQAVPCLAHVLLCIFLCKLGDLHTAAQPSCYSGRLMRCTPNPAPQTPDGSSVCHHRAQKGRHILSSKRASVLVKPCCVCILGNDLLCGIDKSDIPLRKPVYITLSVLLR